MKQNYSTQLLRTVAAQICQTIGWQCVTQSSLEILVDILDRYLKEICKTTHDYAELCKSIILSLESKYSSSQTPFLDNRTEANLDDLGLTFRDLGIDMNEIVEYASYVDPVAPAEVPKFPIPKDSHFNFLKPGSKEVLTRPVHIHEHLPPLNPPEDEPIYNNGSNEKEIDVVGVPQDDNGVFKRPADGGIDLNAGKKIKMEEEGRATREISSVMMTTSGFISPAREGKLPESKPPNLPPEFVKQTPVPLISPPFKPTKDSLSGSQSASVLDKKLEKRMKKKNHEKEKRKEKPMKEKYPLPVDFNEGMQSQSMSQPPSMMPREANEQMINAERKKALKKLKMKNKNEVLPLKKKKEKIPKQQKQPALFEPQFMDKPKIDPFQVLPPVLPPSQIQAHNFLTGAHSIFSGSMMDNTFGSVQTPLIEGKLITEPDKNKLNIFKKITKPKEDPVKAAPVMPSQMDFLSPLKFDRYEQQPSTSQAQQVYNDPMKKVHKLPKETTMTRVEEGNTPINFSMTRSNESSFEELAMPKTPTIPRTPDMKQEKKEKKERKKRERKVEAPDWNQMQNPFMPDMASQNNPFLQTLQNAGSFMGGLGNFPMRNPFGLPPGDLFQTSPGLMQRAPFGMSQLGQMAQMGSLGQNPYGFPLPGMDMNMLQQAPQQSKPKAKKVKPPKPVTFKDDFSMMQSSSFSKIQQLLPQSLNERYDAPQLMNVDHFPLQHHQQPLSSFDQLLKDPQHQQAAPVKKISDDKMETFDLTSSPEPPQLPQEIVPAPVQNTPQQVEQQQTPQLSPVKEKSKEKKKKKDKDKEDRKEEKKKVSWRSFEIFFHFH